MKLGSFALVSTIAVIVGVPGYAAYAQANDGRSTPPRPPWVSEDGSVEISKMPELIPLLDRDGEICGHISREELFREPTLTEERAARAVQKNLPREIITHKDGRIEERVEGPPVGPHC